MPLPRATNRAPTGALARHDCRPAKRRESLLLEEDQMQAPGLMRKLAALALVSLGATGPALGQSNPAPAPGHGVVFTTTNAADGNELVMYHRRPNGTLQEVASLPTGGDGTGM